MRAETPGKRWWSLKPVSLLSLHSYSSCFSARRSSPSFLIYSSFGSRVRINCLNVPHKNASKGAGLLICSSKGRWWAARDHMTYPTMLLEGAEEQNQPKKTWRKMRGRKTGKVFTEQAGKNKIRFNKQGYNNMDLFVIAGNMICACVYCLMLRVKKMKFKAKRNSLCFVKFNLGMWPKIHGLNS